MGKRRRRPDPGSDDVRLPARWTSIQEKCHPALFEIAPLWKDFIEALRSAGPNPPKEVVEALEEDFAGRSLDINNRYPDLSQFNTQAFVAQSVFSESAFASKSADQGVTEWIHYERHKTPFKHDAERISERDWDASRRAQRTIADIEQLRCQKGPIKPFQGNLEHSNIFETTWGLGVEKLTQEELADYFDRYCPCGIEAHDGDALKKHRSRFQKSLENI